MSHAKNLQNYLQGSPYGCWVTPEGRRIAVSAPGFHIRTLEAYLKNTEISCDQAIHSKGYVRVWTDRGTNELIYSLGGVPLTESQKQELLRIRDEWQLLAVRDDRYYEILEVGR